MLHGLRPNIEVTTRTPVRWRLADRMAHYSVPGVSIASMAMPSENSAKPGFYVSFKTVPKG